ncbi:MAG: hypothetical protein ACYDBV_12725, partial [Nitrospiria bacterium]
MSNLFRKYWKDQDGSSLAKSVKNAEDLRAGDVIVSKQVRDIVQSVDASTGQIFVKGRNFNYLYERGDKVEVMDVIKGMPEVTKTGSQKFRE